MSYGTSLSGAVSDHELVSIEVDPPVLPTEVEAQALAASREKALSHEHRPALATAGVRGGDRALLRPDILARRGGGSHVHGGRHRAGLSLLCRLLSALPGRVWSRGGAHVGSALGQRYPSVGDAVGSRRLPATPRRAGARSSAGQYEIVSSLTAPATAPPSAIEALARIWAYRETLRPGDLTDVGGEQQVLAGGMMKCCRGAGALAGDGVSVGSG